MKLKMGSFVGNGYEEAEGLLSKNDRSYDDDDSCNGV